MTPKFISKNEIFKGRIVTLNVEQVLMEDGVVRDREVVRHKEAVCVLAYDDKYVYLVEQYRHPMGEYILEIPAGIIEDGEDKAFSAKRELNEEINGLCDTLEDLGVFYSTPGFADEKIWLFAAKLTGFKKGTPDEDEFIKIHKMTFKSLYKKIMTNKIPDGKTQAIVLKFRSLHPDLFE